MHNYFEKIYKKSSDEFFDIVKYNLKNEKKTFIVTANPETFSYGKEKEFDKLLLDDITTIVPDGIGIVKAAKMLDYDIKERIPGIDIANKLLDYSNELGKKVYLFGSKQEVIDKMNEVIKEKYPNLILVGSTNGYVKDKDKVFNEMKKLKPDVIMVALGIPNQEKLIYKHIKDFDKGIFIGVGGSFDVISGMKKRAPKLFIKLNIEWLYRICKEPSRLKRFWDNNIKFIIKIKKIGKQGGNKND